MYPVVACLAVGGAALSLRALLDPPPLRTLTWRRPSLPVRRGGSARHGRQRRLVPPAAWVPPARWPRAALPGGLTPVGGVGWPRSCLLKASTSSFLGANDRPVMVAPAHRHQQRAQRQQLQQRQRRQAASCRCRRFVPAPSPVFQATARPHLPRLAALVAAGGAPPSPFLRPPFPRLRHLATLPSKRYGGVPVLTVLRPRFSLHLMTFHQKTHGQ